MHQGPLFKKNGFRGQTSRLRERIWCWHQIETKKRTDTSQDEASLGLPLFGLINLIPHPDVTARALGFYHPSDSRGKEGLPGSLPVPSVWKGD